MVQNMLTYFERREIYHTSITHNFPEFLQPKIEFIT